MSGAWDTYIKGAALLSTLIVIPTFGWVWSTNVQVQKMQVELESSQEEIEKMKSNSVDIQGRMIIADAHPKAFRPLKFKGRKEAQFLLIC